MLASELELSVTVIQCTCVGMLSHYWSAIDIPSGLTICVSIGQSFPQQITEGSNSTHARDSAHIPGAKEWIIAYLNLVCVR